MAQSLTDIEKQGRPTFDMTIEEFIDRFKYDPRTVAEAPAPVQEDVKVVRAPDGRVYRVHRNR